MAFQSPESEFNSNLYSAYIEPYFWFLQSSLLVYPESFQSGIFLGHINYQILQNPLSLSDHVRKIRLIEEEELSSDQLIAALADLFFILKQGGYALRQRLLFSSRKFIDGEIYKKFIVKLKTGDLSTSENWLQKFPTLLAEKPAINVVSQLAQSSSADSPGGVMLANEYLENSQIDLAIDTLEKTLLENPVDNAATLLLIELYQSTGNLERHSKMYKKLKQIGGEVLPECWKLTESQIPEFIKGGSDQ
ncbi:MAG: hypothetical protein GY806_16845 [Gammaproteobacteria bacterium]|nr:hypothetical protein [Gammaproteobacteria bacterium]